MICEFYEFLVTWAWFSTNFRPLISNPRAIRYSGLSLTKIKYFAEVVLYKKSIFLKEERKAKKMN